jgi:hypothetical protein
MWGNPQKKLVDKQGDNIAKRNDVGLAFVVGILLLVAIYAGATLFRPTSTIGQPTTGTSTVPSLACANSPVAPTLSLEAYYMNTVTVPATPTQVATPYSIYTSSSPLAITSGTLSATAGTSVSGVNCGQSYSIFVGDNSNYYLKEVQTTVSQTAQQLSVKLTPISLPTIGYNNGTIAGYVGQAKFYAVPNGYTETQLQMKISAGSGYFGHPDYAIIFAYNASQISSIQLNAPTVAVPSSVVSVPAGFATVAYQMSALGNYNSTVVNPIIKTSTLPSNTLVASPIDVYLVSEASYNQNGNLLTGVFANPSTGAAIITPVQSVTTNAGGILMYG